MNKLLNSPIPLLFNLKIIIFSAHDEQTNWITPSIKLPPCQPPKYYSHYISLFAFPPPDSPQTNTSSGMNSDTNSDITVFETISQFNNSEVETPDEYADSEPSPSTYTQTNSSKFSKPLLTYSTSKPMYISLPSFSSNPNLLPIYL